MHKNRLVLRSAALTVILALAFLPPGAHPRQITVVTEQGEIEVLSTRTVVADILTDANIKVDPEYQRVSPALEAEIQSDCIVIESGKQVVIAEHGRERAVITWASTVAGLLAEQGINCQGDLLNCPPEQRIVPGMKVNIVRVDTRLVTEEVRIAAKTTYKSDHTLEQGKKKVKVQARDGKKLVTYEIICHDGIDVSKRVIKEEVVVPPVAGVILKGTKSISRGTTGKAVEGIASYYGAELHGRRTASGVPFDMYAFTAAHRTLPFGTRVKVTYLATGKSVTVVINDRGPFIAGRIIDLSAAAAKAIGLYADGVGRVRIEILQ
ncbi:MAG: septal ring lytic transglycosylase RlpA family protein [Bacillota bacterium]|nr:septal ring lytic transglycosylase RlpA family protein [Bacillota bacterium]